MKHILLFILMTSFVNGNIEFPRLEYTFNSTNGGHTDAVTCLASAQVFLLNFTNQLLLSGSADNTVKVWDLSNSGYNMFTFTHENFVTSLEALSNNLIASASFDYTVRVWDLSIGRLKFSFNHSGEVLCLAYLYENNLLASGSNDLTVKVWNLTSGELYVTFDKQKGGHTDQVNILKSLDYNLLASGSEDNTVNHRLI